MGKIRNNQNGFAALEAVLILVIVGILGFTSWFVWQAKNNADKSLTSNNSTPPVIKKKTTTSKTTTETTTDPTADWVAYSTPEGQYSLKYPKTWVKATSQNLCNPGLLLLGGNAASVGKCASEAFGQMAVDSASGDKVAAYGIDKSLSKDLVTEPVTINNVAGKKQTGSYSIPLEGGPEVQYKKVLYLFYTNNRAYTATYYVDSGYPDVLVDFNAMVTRTLKFEP